MKIVVADTECNDLDPNYTKMWLHGGIDVKTGERYRFDVFRGEKERKAAEEWSRSVDKWVFHNGLGFDLKAVAKFIGKGIIKPEQIIDTLVVSRLIQYDRVVPKGCRSGHSLKAHGIRLGVHKGDFTDFSNFSQEMVDYWESDLDVGLALYEDFKPWIMDPDWRRAMRVEHDIQYTMEVQKFYGFDFDKESAERILGSVAERMTVLEKGFAEDFPPQLEEQKAINYTIKQDGNLGAHVIKAQESYPETKVRDGKLVCYDYVPFKPGSPKMRIDVLWEAGWKPFEKTKTHQQFGRLRVGDPYGKTVSKMDQEFYDDKKEHLSRYGWSCNEDNLKTLPASAPEGARNLAQWLTLEGRRSSLVEWIGQVKEDGRIHGNVMGIGAWTHRAAHNKPNTANISAPFHGKVRTAVDEVKNEFDKDMRALWRVPEGSWLVGVDAEGIQLRVLGDQLWRHFGEREYADTIVNGKKEDETDIHNVNKRALCLDHLTRDHAKTFDLH